MSVALPVVNLATAVVNSTGTVSWEQQSVTAPLQTGHTLGWGTIQVFNESGCGLSIQLQQSSDQTFIAAGGWRTIALNEDDKRFVWTVLYVIANAPVTSLVVLYYAPGEQVDSPGILGNSPIGLSGSVNTAITQVIQDGQPAGQTILESTPTATAQTLLMDTLGNFYMAGILTYGLKVGGSVSELAYVDTPTFAVVIRPPLAGAAVSKGGILQTWDGSNQFNCFSWGGQFGAASAWVDKAGNVFTPKALLLGTPGNGSIDWESNLIVFRTPLAGATAQSHVFQVWDGSAGQNPFEVGRSGSPTGATNISSLGVLSRIAGQATAGSFGVPVIVAQTLRTNVTVTTNQTILSFTPSTTGLYRASGYFSYTNGTPQKPSFNVAWHDPDLGVNTLSNFFALSGTPGQFMSNAQASVMPSGQGVACAPIVFNAQSANAVTVAFQDGGGTPNDFVTALIERLA